MDEVTTIQEDRTFIEWERSVFGYGYGTGEAHVLTALKTFFGAMRRGCNGLISYDYRDLEAACTAPVAWLLINALARDDLDTIEYSTSPRRGWLTERGAIIHDYVMRSTVQRLADVIDNGDDE